MEINEIIIKEVKKYECLYNLASKDYKNVQKKTEIWNRIGNIVNLTDISVKLQGITKVNFTAKQHLFAGIFVNKTYKTSQEHILMKKVLNEIFVLDDGRYLFEFEFLLPKEMPSSIEEAYGRTRYEITLVLNSRYQFSIYKRAITILESFDLNLYPGYNVPIETGICEIPYKNTYVVSLKIAQRAYAPGQTLEYVLLVDNEFEEVNVEFVLHFLKKVTYRTDNNNMTHEHNLLIKLFEGFKINENNIYFFGQFKIPSTPPTTNIFNILTVEYFLNVSVTLSTHNGPINITMPVIIGTKPIQKRYLVKIREEQPRIAAKRAADDEVKFYDLEDDEDIPTTSQAAAERARQQKSKLIKILKAKGEFYEQPITSQAARTAAQRPGEEKTKFKEAAHIELEIIDLEKYSDDESTTPQALKSAKAREQKREQKIDICYEYYAQEPVFETSMFVHESFCDEDYEDVYSTGFFEPIYPVYHSPPPLKRSNR